MQISNKKIEISFDNKNGSIISIKNDKGKEFFKVCDKSLPLFNVGLIIEGKSCDLSSDFAVFKSVETANGLIFNYSNIGGYAVDIKVNITVDKEKISFGFSIDNRTEYDVEYVDFAISVERNLEADGGNAKLFWPAMEGAIIDDVELRDGLIPYEPIGDKSKAWEGLYPGSCPMQFMAYYDDEGGLYISTDDEEGCVKGIEYYAYGKDAICIDYRLFTGSNERHISLSYDLLLTCFVGDWYDAAEIYRKWVEKSSLLNVPKLKDNQNYAKWVFDNPIVVIYCVRGEKDTGDMSPNCYFPYTNGLEYIKNLNTVFDSKLMVVLEHWEGSCPWSPPYVWPPYGDLQNFNKYISDLHNSGNYFGLYCSGLGWTEKSTVIEEYNKEKEFIDGGIEQAICLPRSRKKEYSKICAGCIRWGYDLCSESEITQNIVVDELHKIVTGCDVDYIQFFDQNVGGAGYLCYSKEHGHPSVPGKWQTDSMKKLYNKFNNELKNSCPQKQIMIGCEGAPSENFISNICFSDMRYVINYRVGVPVSAYNYVYNEYAQNFMGNMNSSFWLIDGLKENEETAYYRFAYSFAQGDILTVVLKENGKINWEWGAPWNMPELDQEDFCQYIRYLNDWKKGYLNEIFYYGKMVKPFNVVCDKYNVPLTRRKNGHTVDNVLTTRFKYKNKDVQIFVNYRKTPQDVVVNGINCKKIKLINNPDGQGEVMFADNGEVKLSIKPKSVCVLKFIF